MALAKKKYANLTVFYCPLDFTWAVAAAMRRIRPDVLVLAELELWPNLIRAAKRHGAKVAVINGRLSEKSFKGYRRIRWFIGRLLAANRYHRRAGRNLRRTFRRLGRGKGEDRSHRLDEIRRRGNRPAKSRKRSGFANWPASATDDIVFLAGSTQEPEEEAAIEIFKHLAEEFPRLKLIIVPRHPERFGEVAHLLDQSGVAWQTANGARSPDTRPLSQRRAEILARFARRCRRRTWRMVGSGADRFRGRKFRPPRRTEHDRAGRLRRRRLLRPEHVEFSRYRRHHARPSSGRRGERPNRTGSIPPPLPHRSRLRRRTWSDVHNRSSKAQLGATERTLQLLEGLVE